MATDSDSLPDGWAPYLPIATAVVRALLTSLGGAGFTWALAVNASQVQMAVSAAAVLAGGVWSIWQKVQAQKAIAAAAATAAGRPAPALPA